MVSVGEISDSELRSALTSAETALDDADYPTCVRLCVDAYCRLIEQRPDMIIAARFGHAAAPPQGGASSGPGGGGPGGLVMGGPRPWPSDHGVRFAQEDGGKPTLTFLKERFTLSEAATYFEYTLDLVMRAQRKPPEA